MLERLVRGGTAFGASASCLSDVAGGGWGTGEPSMVTLVAMRPTIVRVGGFGSGINLVLLPPPELFLWEVELWEVSWATS